MALKFRRGTTAQQSGSLAFGEPFVNTTLGTLIVGGASGDIVLASATGAGLISGSSQVDVMSTTNIARLATTGSNIFTGKQSISSSFELSDSAATFQIVGNGFGQTYLQSLNGALVLNPGYGGVEIVGANNSFKAATITGTILSDNGVVSGSSQVTLQSTTGFSSFDTTLSTITGSLISSASSAKTTNDSQGVSITNLNTYTSSLNTAIQLTGSTVSFLGNIVVYGTQSIITSNNVEISDNILYLSPTASIDNDLGIVGHYNDGTYKHAGVFMDASDGHSWKVFNGLQGETTAQIDTAGTGFTLADFKAGAITGTSFNGNVISTNGVISGSSQVQLGSASGNIALATQTTGDYVASLVAGTNITLSNNSGEGATPTIGLTNNTISGISLGSNLAALTIGTGLSGTSYNGSTGVTIANTGVTSNVAGTGVSVSGATGAVTISIGQSVATNATPTFGNLTINGTITATGDITAYYTSDRRHKNNIQTISNAVLKVKQLNGVTWEWNDDVNEVTKSTPKTGLIAQEVQQVLPQVVTERADGFLALDYSKMVGLLVEAIKEQQIQIDQLKAQIGSK